MQILT